METSEPLDLIADEEILTASLKHPSLFVHLVRRYEAPFVRRAERIVGSREEAEDVVQETFTKIYLNAKRFKKQEGASFSSWGYRILINTALTHASKLSRENGRRVQLEPEVLELVPDKQFRQFEKKTLSDEVASVLGRMPASMSRVLAAFFLEGKTQEEIAREEGLSVGAVKTRVHRAKREFQKVYRAITTTV